MMQLTFVTKIIPNVLFQIIIQPLLMYNTFIYGRDKQYLKPIQVLQS